MGSLFALDFKIAGRTQELVYERGHSAAVTYDVNLRLTGPLKLFDLAMQMGFERVAGKAADGLRRTLA